MNMNVTKQTKMLLAWDLATTARQLENPWAAHLMMQVATKKRSCGLEPARAPHRKCRCKGRNRMPKRLYGSYSEAMRIVERRMAQCHYDLYVYRCPSCDGWHLTKNPHRW